MGWQEEESPKEWPQFPSHSAIHLHCCPRSVTSSKDMSWTFFPGKSGYTLSREEGDEVGDGVRAGEIERFIFAN